MTRLEPQPSEPTDATVAAVFAVFAREGREPIELYRVLAHAPRVLHAYSGLARALRYECDTPRQLRELMILRTAQLTGSDYELAHHLAMAEHADVPERQLRELASWRDSEAFDARERAALRCVEEMHAIGLGDDAFAELRSAFAAPEIVEVVMVAALYQAVARVIQAFDLDIEPRYLPYLERWADSTKMQSREPGAEAEAEA